MPNASQLSTRHSSDFLATVAVLRRRSISVQIILTLFLLETIYKPELIHNSSLANSEI
jgi:hypothetical protein